MSSQYKLVIVGSGPAGLSAAGRAAVRDQESGATSPSYLLLESRPQPSETLFRFQKGKHVMAEPAYLKLRSDFPFAPGQRETILQNWDKQIEHLNLNIRFNSEVTSIEGSRGDFTIRLADSGEIKTETVILAIGLQGNPRKLDIPGAWSPWVQYQLDDPEEYTDENIIVVGAGDAAVENAVALAKQNNVTILNRRDEFSRIKASNQSLLLNAFRDPSLQLSCRYNTSPKEIIGQEWQSHRLQVVLNTTEGDQSCEADRVIARLGALPPRRFLESCGIKFPDDSPNALPTISEKYESNVAGIYIIGSLAGYPLIKQAMNQGYDVVEHIHGNAIFPVDRELLEFQFAGLPYMRDVESLVRLMMERVPMFRQLNNMAFRELVIESDFYACYSDHDSAEDAKATIDRLRREIANEYPPGAEPSLTHVIEKDEILYEAGDRGVSFFTVLDGEVILESPHIPGGQRVLKQGEFFGEMSLIAGQPRIERARAGRNCVLMESPRRTILKLMNTYSTIMEGIVWIYTVRELQRHFSPTASIPQLREIAEEVIYHDHAPGEVIWKTGDFADSVFIVQNGTVALSKTHNGRDYVVGQVRAGHLLGEMAIFGDASRDETARASVFTQTIEIPKKLFQKLMAVDDSHVSRVREKASQGLLSRASWEVRPESEGLLHFMLDEGLGEATNALFIDESLCVGCDNCEKACAETHGGISRLQRDAGPSFDGVQVPTSCRHCEQPHCMKDCPPNAINRSSSGEVYIDETCIGCGNCAVNCPYDAIKMAYPPEPKPGLLSWLLFGSGPGPGERKDGRKASADSPATAVKCDACLDQKGGPACVRACPTGAAIRITPDPVTKIIEKS